MNAHLYARFSPRPGAESCNSVDRQLADLRAWCLARALNIGSEHYDKGLSGGDRDRPGLFDAIQACRRGDQLLVRDWDRFSRDRTYAGIIMDDLRKRGVEVRSITESGDMPETLESRLLSNILLDIAEYKRGIIAARTRSAMLAHQQSGRIMSSQLPYGFRDGGTEERGGRKVRIMLPDEGEQKVLAVVRFLRTKGWGYNKIARHLESYYQSRGQRWHAGSVYRMVNRNEGLLPCLT